MVNLQSVVSIETARTKPALAASMLAGAVAAGMYARTLLPGLDLGDTASFQTIVTLPLAVPRHAYPLYFALGKLSMSVLGSDDPAYAMNALSAGAGVAAVIAFAWLACELTGRAIAGLWAALLFAASYTFWSQALIAEVYTLEALFIALALIAAVAWWRRPTTPRLVWLYAIYALSFGNHLSMILLAPALAWLLWAGRNRAAVNPFSARGILLAGGIALAGAMQYLWNFYGLWALSAPRPPWPELFSTFWFDVTKSDWRATLVGTVPVPQWGNRMAMYWWDLRQQFGLLGIAISALGVLVMLRGVAAVAVALLVAYAATFAFAFIYNVGDTHVFLLPSHQVVATFGAAGAAAVLTMAARAGRRWHVLTALALLALPAWRIADTWASVDRTGDHRADRYAEAALAGLAPATTVYVGDLNWQTQNAVGYQVAVHQPEMPRVFTAQVLWHFPEFVVRNHQLGREIVLTRRAAETVAAAYGGMFPLRADTRIPARTFTNVATVPNGTPYVLAVMTPLPESVYSRSEVAQAVRTLAGVTEPNARYVVMAGLAGSPPVLTRAADRPYRASATFAGHQFEVRIESWLPFDTMRRAGFGQVVVDGRHALTLERGATVGVFDPSGRLRNSANQGGSFAVQPRYVIPVLR